VPSVEQLSYRFSVILRFWLSDLEIDTINKRNASQLYREKGYCATHEFCDSNQAMLDALEKFGITWDQPGDHEELIEAAWTMSKNNKFEIKDIDIPDSRVTWVDIGEVAK